MSDLEQRHPKLVIGVSAGVILTIFVMGGQLTYKWGQMDSAVNAIALDTVRIDTRSEVAHGNFVTRQEYAANNAAVLRELQNQSQAVRDLARQVERLVVSRAAEGG